MYRLPKFCSAAFKSPRTVFLSSLLLAFALLPACQSNTTPQTSSTAANSTVARQVRTQQSLSAGSMPDGVNQPDCKPKPGKQHIVLVHGTLHSSLLSFRALAPRLAREGHCLYATDYGAQSPGDELKARRPVEQNAQEVAQSIDRVLKQTGQAKVDLLGYSQGGLIGFHLIRDKGYSGKIRHFMAVAPSVRGTTSEGANRVNQGGTCPACADQFHRSAFMTRFTVSPITAPGVKYTILATRDDWIVTPPENQLVFEPGVRNIWVQDRLKGKTVSHVGLMYDDDVLNLIATLLDDAKN